MYTDTIPHNTLGDIYIYWSDKGIHEVGLLPGHMEFLSVPASIADDYPDVYKYLSEFGKPEKPPFTHKVLDMTGFTGFSADIYKTLFYQPYGKLITYKELALAAGYTNAYRAAGSAMRRNRLLLIVPCHRVVGTGSLGGFSSGMNTKLQLLDMEGIDYSHLTRN